MRRHAVAAVAAMLAACSPADHAYYARGKVNQAVSDGFAATQAYDRYLESRKTHPASPGDIALAARPGTYSAALERDRIVLVLETNLPTGKFDIAGKRITFSAKEAAGKRAWTCVRGELAEILMPESCRER
ncbi:MAG: pilin [Betaproteobacteria bacterium]